MSPFVLKMNEILDTYGKLLQEVDEWFAACMSAYPEHISCGHQCSGCCRGLFDITLLDAWYLKSGFDRLAREVKETVQARAETRVRRLTDLWPEWGEPYILNVRPEEDWELLMPDDDETPCPLLDDKGGCLLYPFRPMTCRLHGLPLIDVCGEPFHDEWCTMNFAGQDPLELRELRWRFRDHFEQELVLFRHFTQETFGHPISEIDTFIPTALLMDFRHFDWKSWIEKHLIA